MKTAEEILQDKFAGIESKINKPNVYQAPLILAAMEEYARAKWDQACEETFNNNAIVFGFTKPEFKK